MAKLTSLSDLSTLLSTDYKVAEKIQESDAYYWKAEYVTKLNQVFKKSGSFLLLK